MIGERIKMRRIKLGMTQEELAQKVGYKSKTTVNKIELGINDITQFKVYAFAKALETTPSYLMEWEAEVNDNGIEVIGNAEVDFMLNHSDEEIYLLEAFKKLNGEGQSKVIGYISDLLDTSKYLC